MKGIYFWRLSLVGVKAFQKRCILPEFLYFTSFFVNANRISALWAVLWDIFNFVAISLGVTGSWERILYMSSSFRFGIIIIPIKLIHDTKYKILHWRKHNTLYSTVYFIFNGQVSLFRISCYLEDSYM